MPDSTTCHWCGSAIEPGEQATALVLRRVPEGPSWQIAYVGRVPACPACMESVERQAIREKRED